MGHKMDDLSKFDKLAGDMDTFDLLLFDGNDPISKAIKFFSKKSTNHAGVVIRFNEPVWLAIAESDPETMAIKLRNKLSDYNGHVYWYKLKKEYHKYRKSLGAKALDYTGTKYDYWDVLKQIFKPAQPDPKKLFCFEMVFLSGAFHDPPLPIPDKFKNIVPVGEEMLELGWWEDGGVMIV